MRSLKITIQIIIVVSVLCFLSRFDMSASEDQGAWIREAEQHYRAGSQAEREGNYAVAESAYLTSLKIAQDNNLTRLQVPPLHRLGVLKAKEKNYPASETFFRQAKPFCENNVPFLCDFAKVYSDQQRFSQAENLLKLAALQVPNDHRVLSNLGHVIAMQKDRQTEGLRYLKLALGEKGAYEEIARIYEFLGDKDQADFARTRVAAIDVTQNPPEISPTVSSEVQDRIRKELSWHESKMLVSEMNKAAAEAEDRQKTETPVEVQSSAVDSIVKPLPPNETAEAPSIAPFDPFAFALQTMSPQESPALPLPTEPVAEQGKAEQNQVAKIQHGTETPVVAQLPPVAMDEDGKMPKSLVFNPMANGKSTESQPSTTFRPQQAQLSLIPPAAQHQTSQPPDGLQNIGLKNTETVNPDSMPRFQASHHYTPPNVRPAVPATDESTGRAVIRRAGKEQSQVSEPKPKFEFVSKRPDHSAFDTNAEKPVVAFRPGQNNQHHVTRTNEFHAMEQQERPMLVLRGVDSSIRSEGNDLRAEKFVAQGLADRRFAERSLLEQPPIEPDLPERDLSARISRQTPEISITNKLRSETESVSASTDTPVFRTTPPLIAQEALPKTPPPKTTLDGVLEARSTIQSETQSEATPEIPIAIDIFALVAPPDTTLNTRTETEPAETPPFSIAKDNDCIAKSPSPAENSTVPLQASNPQIALRPAKGSAEPEVAEIIVQKQVSSQGKSDDAPLRDPQPRETVQWAEPTVKPMSPMSQQIAKAEQPQSSQSLWKQQPVIKQNPKHAVAWKEPELPSDKVEKPTVPNLTAPTQVAATQSAAPTTVLSEPDQKTVAQTMAQTTTQTTAPKSAQHQNIAEHPSVMQKNTSAQREIKRIEPLEQPVTKPIENQLAKIPATGKQQRSAESKPIVRDSVARNNIEPKPIADDSEQTAMNKHQFKSHGMEQARIGLSIPSSQPSSEETPLASTGTNPIARTEQNISAERPHQDEFVVRKNITTPKNNGSKAIESEAFLSSNEFHNTMEFLETEVSEMGVSENRTSVRIVPVPNEAKAETGFASTKQGGMSSRDWNQYSVPDCDSYPDYSNDTTVNVKSSRSKSDSSAPSGGFARSGRYSQNDETTSSSDDAVKNAAKQPVFHGRPLPMQRLW